MINTLLLHIPLLALTDRQTDIQTEERINPGWAGHPDGFIQVNPGWAGHPDGFLQVHTTYVLRVPYSCGVVFSFFGSGGK